MTTREALAAMKDRGDFESLATAALRFLEPDCAAVIHHGVNAAGETVKAPVDAWSQVPGSNPPRFVIIQHTTTDKAKLRGKWLAAPNGDLSKAATQAAEYRARFPGAAFRLFLTTNIAPDSSLQRDIYVTADEVGIEAVIVDQTRLADFLDTANGQYLRRKYLKIEADLLSRDLLIELSKKSSELHAREFLSGETTLWKERELDRKLQATLSDPKLALHCLAAEAGFGKSTIAQHALRTHIEGDGFALWISSTTFENASSIEDAINRTLRDLLPSLSPETANAWSVICAGQRLLLVVDDINRTADPRAQLRRLQSGTAPLEGASGNTSGNQRFVVICPVWPNFWETEQDPSRQRKWVSLIRVGAMEPDEAATVIQSTARHGGRNLVLSEADECGERLNRDPYLIAIFCSMLADSTPDILTARDFHQIAGRAGRKGFDDLGWVVAQAPEYVVENLRLEQSGKKFVKRKPPEKHFANWDNNTFTRLISAPPERLASRFQVTHGMLLNVLSRNEDGCRAMRNLINDCHDSAKEKKAHRRRAFQLFRALVERKIIEFISKTPEGAKVRVNAELQYDFSLNQTLAIFVHDTIPLLDPESPEYPLLILTLAESILEDPAFILRKQLDQVKTDAMVEMKAQGLDYNERLEELEKLEYPKPNREFIYPTFNAFAARHPWVGTENIRLKSIAREMFEDYRSFDDYVKLYDLQRAEGILLRHLSGVYKVLRQTVPDSAKDDGVLEIEHYFALMLRQVDSSLIQEWEKMRDPNYRPPAEPDKSPKPEAAPDIMRNLPAFKAAIRARIFTFLRAAASGDVEGALTVFPENDGNPGADSIKASLTSYQAGHQRIRLDPEARNSRHLHVTPSEDNLSWNVQQTIVDPEEFNDWVVELQVDLGASREAETPVMWMLGIHPLS